MSLYKDASLVMLPSAYKDNKLYSIRPTDGSGDFTFSRGTNLSATRVNASQLIEKGRENVLLQSNQFDTTWQRTTGTFFTSGQGGYDGSNNAWLLNDSGQSSAYAVYQSLNSSGVLTASIYAKAGSTNIIELDIQDNASTPLIRVDLSTGTITGGSAIDQQVQSIGNGWYRISVTGNLTSVNFIRIGCNGAGSIYIQDAQLEQGLVATDYIETGASTAQAGILENTPRLDYSGGASCPSLLLEPSRTNGIASSEYFQDASWNALQTIVTSNELVSLEGVQNASKLLAVAGLANHQIDGMDITISSGAVTGSVFAKKGANVNWIRLRLSGTSNPPRAWFDLENGVVGDVDVSGSATIEDMGNGWYRCSLTEAGNTTSGSGGRLQIFLNESNGQTEFNADGDEYHYIYGAQMEQGTYPTSYIPTYSVSQTRAQEIADGVTIDTTANHTMLYDFDGTTGRETSTALFNIGYDISNRYFIKGSSSSSVEFQVATVGVFSGLVGLTNEVSGRNKIAVQWIDGTGYVYSNGVKQSGTLSNSSSANNIDYYKAEGRGYSHEVNQLLIFNTPLTDSECIALTTI